MKQVFLEVIRKEYDQIKEEIDRERTNKYHDALRINALQQEYATLKSQLDRYAE